MVVINNKILQYNLHHNIMIGLIDIDIDIDREINKSIIKET